MGPLTRVVKLNDSLRQKLNETNHISSRPDLIKAIYAHVPVVDSKGRKVVDMEHDIIPNRRHVALHKVGDVDLWQNVEDHQARLAIFRMGVDVYECGYMCGTHHYAAAGSSMGTAFMSGGPFVGYKMWQKAFLKPVTDDEKTILK